MNLVSLNLHMIILIVSGIHLEDITIAG